jgi:hypothetical protein
MAELTLTDLPPRPVAEIKDWAKLRRETPEAAAVELLWIGLHAVRERRQDPDALLDAADDRVRH